jgi:hypothetical protein
VGAVGGGGGGFVGAGGHAGSSQSHAHSSSSSHGKHTPSATHAGGEAPAAPQPCFVAPTHIHPSHHYGTTMSCGLFEATNKESKQLKRIKRLGQDSRHES